jgi:hypothetical protein
MSFFSTTLDYLQDGRSTKEEMIGFAVAMTEILDNA